MLISYRYVNFFSEGKSYKIPSNQLFPMVFLRFSYGFPSVPRVFLRFSYGFPFQPWHASQAAELPQPALPPAQGSRSAARPEARPNANCDVRKYGVWAAAVVNFSMTWCWIMTLKHLRYLNLESKHVGICWIMLDPFASNQIMSWDGFQYQW